LAAPLGGGDDNDRLGVGDLITTLLGGGDDIDSRARARDDGLEVFEVDVDRNRERDRDPPPSSDSALCRDDGLEVDAVDREGDDILVLVGLWRSRLRPRPPDRFEFDFFPDFEFVDADCALRTSEREPDGDRDREGEFRLGFFDNAVAPGDVVERPCDGRRLDDVV